MNTGVIFFQFFERETSTYTYLIADEATREAAFIDSVLDTADRDWQWIQELNLNLKYILDTHVHADHITGAGELRKRSGAKTAISMTAGIHCADIGLVDGQTLFLGTKEIRAIATPGHTNTCMSFYFEGMIFTGDALLIHTNGRTDFQSGSAEELFHSIREKLFKLPRSTRIYPGHDYKGQTSSTIGLEMDYNPRVGLSRTLADFVLTMSELKLDEPKRIHEALPANLACGHLKS